MPKSTKTPPAKKKRGRPSVGAEVLLGAKVPAEMAREFESWAAARKLTKSEALRQILIRTLNKKPADKV